MSMAGHGMGMGGGGGQFGGVMRSMRRDESVTQQHVTKGTAKRMVQFARPYRRILAWFLVLVVVDAVIGVVNPLLFRSIIDNGIPEKNKSLILGLALVAAVLAIADSGLSIGIRWVSASVGEGLIYDMRSQVFEHIQKMPIAFFTRTQTGALISRLNNDVIGAQQAFTDTLSSVVSNLISVTLVLIVMFLLSWQITLISLVILPVFVLPAKRVGRRLSAITRESYGLNAQMNNTMTERFNVSGALLVKLFGRPREERDAFESRVSAKVGEGLIFDMRSKVFEHIQKMPIAFFTRTQTGALISRLNNDVIGAQQAFTDTLSSVVSNLISVTLVLIVMFLLSWQITLISLVILPVFVLPAKRVGRRLSAITRESYGLNAQMNNTMTERFNVSGALLVKLFGRPREERDAFESKAGRVRDIGVTQAMYARFFIAALTLTAALATAVVYGWGGLQ